MNAPPDGRVRVRCPGCSQPIVPGAQVVSVDPRKILWHRSCRKLTNEQIMKLRDERPELAAAAALAMFGFDGPDRDAAHQVLADAWWAITRS